MPYSFSKNKLSDNEYNDLINSNSLEEIKNKLNAILVEDSQENNSTLNLFLVRSLSLNEYTNYIHNSTLDGSTTKDNINVWHYVDRLNSTYNHSHGYRQGGQDYHEQVNGFYVTILSNNSSNNYTIKNRVETITVQSYYSGRTGSSSVTIPNTMTNTKSSITTSLAYTAVATVQYPYKATYHFNYTSGFRPCFQYIDNRKSNNIFN